MTWWIPAAYALCFALIVYRYATRRPRLADWSPQTDGALVSVIVPARNEVENIEACVRSILETSYRPFEVIVVDDRSTDGTVAIVERLAGVRLVRGAEPPRGWFGKQWALVQGYRLARGEVLLFVDADTRQHPELIPRAMSVLTSERVALVSVMARQEMVTFWERLVQPHVFVALGARVGDLRRVNRTRVEWDAIANGQFILTTRAAYETVGTHQAVKASVVDDMALAQTYVRHHLDIFLTHGEQYMVTRMYRSLAGIVEGWTKNLATGVPLAFPPLPLLRRVLPHVMWLPALLWVVPPLAWALFAWCWAAATTLISLAIWVAVYWAVSVPLWYALLYPLGASVVAWIMMRSAWRGSTKVQWRGRVYTPHA